MTFRVRREERSTTNGLDGSFWILEETASGAVAEVWPALGFNCTRWATLCDGRLVEWLYAADDLLSDSRPTRSGIPILFPFPNRIADGVFHWDKKPYHLPRNDTGERNVIHGFACRHPWRVIDSGAADDSAWIVGEFHASCDAPTVLPHFWPADHRLRLTIRLAADRLRLEAEVDNPDTRRLPFGLGYHPYFRLPATPERTWIQVPARKFWGLRENLPDGATWPVEEQRDLRSPQRLGELRLDDVFTDLDNSERDPVTGLYWRGSVGEDVFELQMHTSPDFGEMVVFTPPHRQAVCLEPYTCVTNAINLAYAINLREPAGPTGLRILEPGERWSGVVEMVVVE